MNGKWFRSGIVLLSLVAFAAFTGLGQGNVVPLGIIPTPPESSELEVNVWVDQPVYEVGDPITISYSVNQAAYIYIWDILPDGTAVRIFPNEEYSQNDNFVQAGEHTLQGQIGPPYGTEYVQILATTSPVDPFAFFTTDPEAFQSQIEVQILGILPVTERSWDFTSFEIVQTPPSGSYGIVNLTSDPSGALVYLDGVYVGYTPKTIFVPQGFSTFVVTKPGYSTWQAATLVIGNLTRNIHVDLTPLGGAANQSPNANFTYAPSNPGVGDWVQFDATSSSDPDGSLVSYAWSFGDGSTANGSTVWHRFMAGGSFVVTLTVTDNEGATDAATFAVQVGSSNVAPNAAFIYTPPQPTPGSWVQFNATGSSDSDGSIASYAWSFGDGATASNGIVWHRFNAAGSYLVTLVVTDDDGATGTVSQTVVVGSPNQSPVAAFSYTPTNPGVGAWIQFNGAASSDADGSIASYAWDFGDGSSDAGSVAWKFFSAAGTYLVTLTVTDDDGATNAISQPVVVGTSNVAPNAAFAFLPSSPQVAEWVRFDASSSSDSDGTIANYQWSFGDGTSPVSGAVVYHQFTAQGSYSVTLTVTDDDGATDSAVATVVVGTAAQAPVGVFSFSPSAPIVGQPVTFNAQASYDPDGVVVQYLWDLDGNGIDDTSGPTVNATYNNPGVANVRLTVIDNDGLSSTTTQTVIVTLSGGSGTPGVPPMGTTPGIFVWGTDSWHLTVNAGAGWTTAHSYRLELRTDDGFQNINQSSSGVAPLGILPTPTPSGKTLIFEGSLQSGSVDYEFRTPGSASIWMKLQLDLDGDGTLDTSSSFVYLRGLMVHPPTSPFVVGLPSGSTDELTPSLNFRIGSAITYTESTRFVFWSTTISALEAP